MSCVAATTANITLSGTQTLDGIALVAGNRCLVKNQTAAQDNGIYDVSASTWTRSADANTISEIAGAAVNIDSGTVNGGKVFDTDLKTTDTLGTTTMNWYSLVDINESIKTRNHDQFLQEELFYSLAESIESSPYS
jgi:phage-related tail fiber protein